MGFRFADWNNDPRETDTAFGMGRESHTSRIPALRVGKKTPSEADSRFVGGARDPH
jgi:hypothetical protein